MTAILQHLLREPAALTPSRDLAEFRAHAEARAASFTGSVDRAVAFGFAADRLGYAFAGGYGAALHRLVPSLAAAAPACLCATEEGGGHPRAMTTRLAQTADGAWSVTGRKTWATLASPDATLLVVATLGAGPSGKNRLKVVRIPADRAGVTVSPRPPMPFAPEIPHAEVAFDAVVVAGGEILEGDGYDRYVKPFRTVEDIHVLAGALGYLVAVARAFGWGRGFVEGAFVDITALRALGDEEPLAPELHVALGGVFANVRRRLVEAEAAGEWEKVSGETRAMWARDRGILDVAEGARRKRLESAWSGG